MLVLVIGPLALTFLMSFYSTDGMQIISTLTLKNYALFFTDPLYVSVLAKSMIVALIIAVLSILTAYPLAYLVSFRLRRGKQLLFMLSIIPLWVSYLVRIIAWRTILGNKGVINSALLAIGAIREPLTFLLYNRFAIAITLTYICIPFVFIPVYTALEKIPRNILEASSDLGAGELRTFFNVVFPLSLPGLVTGFIFAFIIALGDYIIPIQLGGTQGIMFGNLIWNQFGFAFNWPLGAALGFILFGISVVVLTATSRFGTTEGGFLSE
jgi:spermidine/putrescine transport system permease protein